MVGIGINANWPVTDGDLPAELIGSATSLRQQLDRPVDRARLLESLLLSLGPRVADLETPPGRKRQADDLRAACTTIGTTVRVDLADGHWFEGVATDVTPEGHLVVATGDRPLTVVAGDVIHVRPG